MSCFRIFKNPCNQIPCYYYAVFLSFVFCDKHQCTKETLYKNKGKETHTHSFFVVVVIFLLMAFDLFHSTSLTYNSLINVFVHLVRGLQFENHSKS